MTALAEERHYRRGLVLGLTISELMLLLLFILMLLLSYLLRQEEENLKEAQKEVEILQKKIKSTPSLIELEDLRKVAGETEGLKEEISLLEKANKELTDEFGVLVATTKALKQEIENSPSLVELEDLKEDKRELQTELNKTQQDLAISEQAVETAASKAAEALVDEMYNSREDLIEGVLNELQENGVNNASPDYKDGVLRLPQDVLFESGEGDLSQAGKENVDLLAEALAKWIPCYTPARAWACQEGGIRESSAKLSAVFIEGHTDDRPVVDPETKAKYGDNWGLSSARAISAFNRIIEHDPRLKDFKNEEGQALLSISGYADNRPAADKWTPGGREKNRRIDVRFIFAPNAESGQKEEVRGVSGAVDLLSPAEK